MSIDFARISADALSSAANLVPHWCPGGKRVGPEWVAPNPTRSDKTIGSFKVNLIKGNWKDFANGDGGGDLIDLYGYCFSVEPKEAALRLTEILGGPLPDAPKGAKGAKDSKWVAVPGPVPREATPSDMEWPKLGALVAWWAYRDIENRIVGYVCRFEDGDKHGDDGKPAKQTLPLQWCRNTENGKERFGFKGFPEPRPLFNVGSVGSHPGMPVLIVEGEKCGEAAANLIGDKIPVVTWPGGGKAVHLADWSYLKGRSVVIWPDNDADGINCAQKLLEILEKLDCTVNLIVPRVGSVKGWDCHNFISEGNDRKAFLGFMNRSSKKPDLWNKIISKQMSDDLPPANYNEQPDDYYDNHQEYQEDYHHNDNDISEPPQNNRPLPEETNFGDAPFRCLGHNRENFYYLPRNKGQIISLSASSHNQANFITLANRYWWQTEFPGKRGPSWNDAAERLIWENYRQGIFTPEKVRGRGAWIDGDDVIIHKGDCAIVNGQQLDPVNYEGSYIYERGRAMAKNSNLLASKDDGIKVLDLCKMFPWKSDVHGVLAAGWAFLSPVCGALVWRPHIWMTGEAGSGKSWFKDNILKPFVSGFGLMAQGQTTASGVRQSLAKDALPVLFDEAESNDRRGAERIAEVLELMRQSSMPGESAIIKGSAGGESTSFLINSMFALVSIVQSIKQQADEGRITSLELLSWSPAMEKYKGRTKKEHFGLTSALCAELFTPEKSQAFRNRAFANILTIQKNIEIFREVCADHFGNQRAGDQIGTLLAGAFCLAANGIASREKAVLWVEAQDWSEQTAQGSGERDQDAILRVLLQETLSLQTHSGRVERNIEQLIRAAIMNNGGPNKNGTDTDIAGKYAKEILDRIGIFVTKNEFDPWFEIAYKHTGLDKIFRDTPWAVGYHKILLRVDGAESKVRKIKGPGNTRPSQRRVRLNAEFITNPSFDDDNETPNFEDLSEPIFESEKHHEYDDVEEEQKELFDGF